MASANAVQQLGDVVFQVAALCHEQGGNADALMTCGDEFGDGVSQRRCLKFEECEFDGEIRAGCGDTRGDGAEGLCPFRITRAVSEQHQT